MTETDMNSSRCKTEINIYGSPHDDINIDLITELLGITPTYTRKRRDFPEVSQRLMLAQDGWAYEIPYDNICDIDTLVTLLLGLFSDKIHILNHLRETLPCNTTFNIVINTTESAGYPKMLLSKEFVEVAATINAKISIALYRY